MRIKSIKTFLAAALLAISGSALAEGTDGITIDDVTVAPGQSQAVTINYSFNDMVYHGFEIILVFPDGSPSHIVKVSDEGQEQLDCTLSDALGEDGAEFTLYSFDNGADGYLFRSLSLKSNTIPLGVGELLSFNIEADAEAAVGEKFSVTVQEARFAFKNETTDELEWKYFDPFTFDVTISDRVILDENSTKVPQASDGPADVTVLRTINPNEWSTICLPFTMTPSIFEAAFDGNTVEVAEFTGFETEYSSLDDLSPDAITLDFTVFKPTPLTITPLKGTTVFRRRVPFTVKRSNEPLKRPVIAARETFNAAALPRAADNLPEAHVTARSTGRRSMRTARPSIVAGTAAASTASVYVPAGGAVRGPASTQVSPETNGADGEADASHSDSAVTVAVPSAESQSRNPKPPSLPG